MLQISCPWCGQRDEPEFRCGGESHIARPGPPNEVSGEAWAEYLHFRTNPKGLHFERWLHLHGCGRWFNLARDTVTHEIRAVYKITEPPPADLIEMGGVDGE